MYCPQCGTLHQDGAISCHNCGTSLNDPNPLKEQPVSEKVKASSLGMSIASSGIGMLSFWPYLFLVSRLLYPALRQKPFFHSAFNFHAFDLACLGGFPLGLVGIVLGVIAWRRSPKNMAVTTMAVTGILLSIGGIAGHIWFIATCQFCQ